MWRLPITLYQIILKSLSKNNSIDLLEHDRRPSSANLDVNLSVHRRSSLDPILHQCNTVVTTTLQPCEFQHPARCQDGYERSDV